MVVAKSSTEKVAVDAGHGSWTEFESACTDNGAGALSGLSEAVSFRNCFVGLSILVASNTKQPRPPPCPAANANPTAQYVCIDKGVGGKPSVASDHSAYNSS